MKHLMIASILLFSSISFANSDTYYQQYPVGVISENVLYDLLNQQREKLRDCHRQYLTKLPGGFDSLSMEFLIDPQGYAKPFAKPLKSETSAAPKTEAIDCLKTLIKSIKFPAPNYGVVFVRFESDIDLQNQNEIQKQELARSAVTMIPYVPQKIIGATIEMYMPYYRGCFNKPFVEKKEPGKITVRWNISEEGVPVDIQVTSDIANPKMSQCLTQVTERHRYPSGFIKTPVERSFSIK